MGLISKDLYKYYQDQGGKLSYREWASICQEFNQRAMEEIILEGEPLHMGHNLSSISIVRIRRSPDSKVINWQASYNYRDELLEKGEKLYDKETKEGKKWFVYFTHEWYCRFYWRKENCTVPNKTAYRFRATRGQMGNKGKLINLLQSDDMAYLNFRKLSD